MVKLIVQSSHITRSFSIFFPLLVALHNSLVLAKFGTTGASPCTSKILALLTLIPNTSPRYAIMFFEGMLTETFEVIGPMRRNIVVALAFTLRGLTVHLLCLIVEILMVLELVVTETLCLRADHLAVQPLDVAPT
jgi:hypothetical protein